MRNLILGAARLVWWGGILPNHLYPPVHRCIYCGTTVLPRGVSRFTDEHIIPLALGGNLILPESSCHDPCAKIINKEIETPILFKEWRYLRIKRSFPTRDKAGQRKARNTTVKLTQRDGRPMHVSIMNYSCPVPLYKFKRARILSRERRGDDNFHWTMEMLASHDDEMEMQRKFTEWNGHHSILTRPYQFARLIAKIAFSYAVAEYGLDGFHPLVTDIILGRSDDYFYTVGGSLDISDAIPGGDHITNMTLLVRGPKRALIIINVRLFSQIRTPSYHVAVGEIDFENPKHIAIFSKHRMDGKIPNIPFTI